MLALLMIVIAYLIGSLSAAIITAKILGLPDPRGEGSRNAGATNMMRLAGKKTAAVVMAGDVLKGLIVVLIAKFVGVEGFALGLVALAAVIGHIFPVFFQFRGGKGVATLLGGTLALSFWLGLIVIIVWLIVAYLSKYSSLASLLAATISPFIALFVAHSGYFLPLILAAALIVYKHQENIQRLRSGSESKIQW